MLRRPEVALLVQPGTGSGRGARVVEAAAARLRAAGVGVSVVSGRDPAEALERTRSALSDGVDALVAIGEDATVDLALRSILADAPPGSLPSTALGLVPVGGIRHGTHHAATSLGIATGDVSTAVDGVLAGLTGGRRRVVDVAWCRGHPFLSVLTAGAGRTTRSFVLEIDGATRRVDAVSVAVGHAARLTDGRLEVTVDTAGPLRRSQTEQLRASRVTIAAQGIVARVHGERVGPLPLTVECVSEAVSVLA